MAEPVVNTPRTLRPVEGFSEPVHTEVVVFYDDNSQLHLVHLAFPDAESHDVISNASTHLPGDESLFRARRAALLLHALPAFDGWDLSYVYDAVSRFEPHTRRSHSQKVIQKVGAEVYQKIMTDRVPRDFLSIALDFIQRGKSEARELNEEIAARTVVRQPDFARVVSRPLPTLAQEQERESRLRYYQRYQYELALHLNQPMDSPFMNLVRDNISEATERGLHVQHGPDVVFALGAIRAQVEYTASLRSKDPRLKFQRLPMTPANYQIHLDDIADWASLHFQTGIFLLRHSIRQPEEYRQLLPSLISAWDDMEITHPI